MDDDDDVENRLRSSKPSTTTNYLRGTVASRAKRDTTTHQVKKKTKAPVSKRRTIPTTEKKDISGPSDLDGIKLTRERLLEVGKQLVIRERDLERRELQLVEQLQALKRDVLSVATQTIDEVKWIPSPKSAPPDFQEIVTEMAQADVPMYISTPTKVIEASRLEVKRTKNAPSPLPQNSGNPPQWALDAARIASQVSRDLISKPTPIARQKVRTRAKGSTTGVERPMVPPPTPATFYYANDIL